MEEKRHIFLIEEFQIIYPFQAVELNSPLEYGLHLVTFFQRVEREENQVNSQGRNLANTTLSRH